MVSSKGRCRSISIVLNGRSDGRREMSASWTLNPIYNYVNTWIVIISFVERPKYTQILPLVRRPLHPVYFILNSHNSITVLANNKSPFCYPDYTFNPLELRITRLHDRCREKLMVPNLSRLRVRGLQEAR